jgi:hypothetical protein
MERMMKVQDMLLKAMARNITWQAPGETPNPALNEPLMALSVSGHSETTA